MINREEIKEEIEDLSKESLSETPAPSKEAWHPDKEKMKLASLVLLGIFIFFILTIICSYLSAYLVKCGYQDTLMISNSLFELCKTGLLPIITLILGYYFSKND